ncbi:DUF3040 domain-containing protein [Streptosporangium sp. NPDC004631]
MLSDREREALREIQCRLLVEDPGFAQSFNADVRRLNRASPDLTWWTYTNLLVLSLTFGVILLMAGTPVGALMFTVTAAALWQARRRRDRSGHPRP